MSSQRDDRVIASVALQHSIGVETQPGETRRLQAVVFTWQKTSWLRSWEALVQSRDTMVRPPPASCKSTPRAIGM